MKIKYDLIPEKNEKIYTSKKNIQKDSLVARKEKDHKVLAHCQALYRDTLPRVHHKVFDRAQTLEWELIQWADSDFVSWVNEQPPSMILAVMAEMKQSPKLNPSLEKLRQKVSAVPLYSIEIYCREKRLGERSCQFLKDMKKKYGPSLLRILYLTSG